MLKMYKLLFFNEDSHNLLIKGTVHWDYNKTAYFLYKIWKTYNKGKKVIDYS